MSMSHSMASGGEQQTPACSGPESISDEGRRPSRPSNKSFVTYQSAAGKDQWVRENDNGFIHPDSTARTAHNHLDLHDALRSQLPAFKQSRRWVKAYTSQADSKPKPLTVPAAASSSSSSSSSSSLRRRRLLVCDTSQQPRSVAAIDLASSEESEPEHRSQCGPAYVTGWQLLKRRRLWERPSMPMRISRPPVSKSPNRMRSTTSRRVRMRPNPSGQTVSEPTQGKGRICKQPQLAAVPFSLGEKQEHQKSSCSLISALSQACANDTAKQSASPVSPLHDYEQIKRFSEECVDMLSGLDLGDHWCLSTVEPLLSIPLRSSSDTLTRPAGSQLDNPEHKPSVLVTQDRSEDMGNDRMSRRVQSSEDFNWKRTESMAKVLKNARSIDTLTQIEAQVDKQSGSVLHQLRESSSALALPPTPPPKLRSSGEPPERPLPTLPCDDALELQCHPCERPSRGGDPKQSSVLDEQLMEDSLAPMLMTATTACSAVRYTNQVQKPARRQVLDSIQPSHTPPNTLTQASSSLNSILGLDKPEGSNSHDPGYKRLKQVVNHRRCGEDRVVADEVIACSSSSRSDDSTVSDMKKQNEIIRSTDMPAQGHSLGADVPSHIDVLSQMREKERKTVNVQDTKVAPAPVRTLSNASFPSRKSGRRHSKLQPSSQNPDGRAFQKRQQTLSHSQIMVIVDTNPHTSSFRAGVLSPTPSMMSVRSNSGSPLNRSETQRDLGSAEHAASTSIMPQCQLKRGTDQQSRSAMTTKSPSIQTRNSSRNFRSQGTRMRMSTFGESQSITDSYSFATAAPRSRRSSFSRRMLDSSGSESEGVPIGMPRGLKSFLRDRDALTTDPQRGHRQQVSSLTALLQEELHKVDQEMENLLKHERKVRERQLRLEQTLKVWDRMSQDGKKQYLASVFGSANARPGDDSGCAAKDEVDSVTLNLVFGGHAKTDKSKMAVGDLAKESAGLVQKAQHGSRRVSGASTAIGTDIETDASEATNYNLDKHAHARGGSLADPRGYDESPTSPFSQSNYEGENSKAVSAKRTGSDVLGTDLDELRARLQANRPPGMLHRLFSTISGSRPGSSTVTEEKAGFKTLADRFAVAPWEEQEEQVKIRGMDSSESLYLQYEGEGLRTDEMDAMLAM